MSRVLLLLLLLVLTPNYTLYSDAASSQCSLQEIVALLELQKAVDPQGKILSSWIRNSSDCCSWRGVQCSHDLITELNLNNCNGTDPSNEAVLQRLHQDALAGELTSSAISALARALPYLSVIDLGCQNLHGNIPVEVGNLTSLTYLDLSFQATDPRIGRNVLTGPIPDTLWSLPKLSYIDFGYNSLTGSISELIGNCTSLTTIYLTTNNLTGSLPASIANLSSLIHLDVSSNVKLGELPPQNWSPSFQLQSLDISLCSFSGPFPAWISSQTNLTTFTLTSNYFTGEIPLWAWRLATDSLDFSGNKFNNILSCRTVSVEEQPYPSLTSLDVSANQLSGALPCFVANLTSLTTLSFASNSFAGPLYSDLFTNLTNLQDLDLSSNGFEGVVPKSFGNLESLQSLDLDSNHFSQTIPSFMLRLPSLSRLDLSDNNFTSSIPSVVAASSSLKFLKLSHNQLTGEIPSSLASFQKLTFLRLDDNKFTGRIPSSLANLTHLQTIDLSNNQFRGPLPLSLKNLSNLVIFNINNNPIGGAIPSVIMHFHQLLVINLGSCRMNGSIPSWIGTQLKQLQVLDLSDNMLSGSLPAALGSLKGIIAPNSGSSAKAVASHDNDIVDDMDIRFKGEHRTFSNLELMTILDFSGNRLSGQIPSELGNLKGLLALDLSDNVFSGAIPSSLGQLMQLESLDLSRNNLRGQIPNSFDNLLKLGFVNLSNNHLSGSIPSSNQWTDTFTESSFLNNDGLCKLTSDSVAKLPLCSDMLKGHLPSSTSSGNEDGGIGEFVSWGGFLAGYPIGLLLGFLIVILYVLKHHKRGIKDSIQDFRNLFKRSPKLQREDIWESESLYASNQEWEDIIARIHQEMNTSVSSFTTISSNLSQRLSSSFRSSKKEHIK